MTTAKEEKRLQAFRQGSEQVFRACYERYWKALCFFAFRVTGSEADSRDLVQEAFVNLWRSREAITSENHIRLFLYQATRHRCLNWIRNRKAESDFRVEYHQLAEEVDFADRVVEEEVQRLIMEQIASLPGEQKRVVELHLKGKNNQEIAEIMHIAVNTVRTHKARARKTLKESLDYLFFFLFFSGL